MGERPSSNALSPRWWGRDYRWLGALAPLLVFAAHLSGGEAFNTAIAPLTLLSAILLGVCLLVPGLRTSVGRVSELGLPGLLFAGVLLAALWSLTPLGPDGPQPVWEYVDLWPGTATLDRSLTMSEMTQLVGLACLFGVGVVIGASDSRAAAAVNVVIAAGALFVLWFFLQWASGAASPITAEFSGRSRLGGPFTSANTFATLCGLLAMLAAGRISSGVRSLSPSDRLAGLAPRVGIALIFLAALLATASRGGAAATVAGLAVFALLQIFSGRTNWSRTLLIALGVAIVLIAFLAAGGDLVLTRLLEINEQHDPRAGLYAAHWQAWRQAPLLGYGLGTFEVVNGMIMNAQNVGDLWINRTAHNVYLSWLEQAGVIGAALMFACLGVIMWSTLKNTLRRTRMTSTLIGLLAANVVILVHGLSDFALETYSMAALWALLLGLQFSLAQSVSRR